MSDSDYYEERARAERAAADAAEDPSSFYAHIALAREYEWRAATEPYEEPMRPWASAVC